VRFLKIFSRSGMGATGPLNPLPRLAVSCENLAYLRPQLGTASLRICDRAPRPGFLPIRDSLFHLCYENTMFNRSLKSSPSSPVKQPERRPICDSPKLTTKGRRLTKLETARLCLCRGCARRKAETGFARLSGSWIRAGAVVLAAFVACAISSCQLPRQIQVQDVSLQIELDTFSGRPNPHWELRGEQTAEFLKRFRALPPEKEGRSIDEGLGYRGFIVTANSGPLDGYEYVKLYRGTVRARLGDRTQTFSDQGRALERWLLDSTRGHVRQSLLQFVQREIER